MIKGIKRKLNKVRKFGLAGTTQRLLGKVGKRFNILPAVPPTVYIELTDICNLECVMCDRQGMTRKSGLMKMDLFKKIIDNAAEVNVPSVKLNRFGESLIHPSLVEMIKYSKDKGIPWVYFTSNATLLTEEKSRMLITSGLDSITFSFDGATPETYEKIRIKANYEKVVNNIIYFSNLRKELGRDKPRIVINTVLMRETQDEIFQVFEKWAPYVDKINVLPVGRYGNVDDLAPIERSDGQIRRRPCHQIFDRMMIFWDGTVTVCCADINADLKVGHIQESRIESLWKNELFSALRGKHLQNNIDSLPTCVACDITNAEYFDEMQRLRKDVYRKARSMGYTCF